MDNCVRVRVLRSIVRCSIIWRANLGIPYKLRIQIHVVISFNVTKIFSLASREKLYQSGKFLHFSAPLATIQDTDLQLKLTENVCNDYLKIAFDGNSFTKSKIAEGITYNYV